MVLNISRFFLKIEMEVVYNTEKKSLNFYEIRVNFF